MRVFLLKKYYSWKFARAYMTLRKLADRHRDAGHEVHFNAVNEANIALVCIQCPELQPLKRPKDQIYHATRDRYGNAI